MGKSRGTPDDLDWLFDRDIIDEEDYVEFWRDYWKSSPKQREQLIQEYVDRAAESDSGVSVGIVTKNKSDAEKQAQALSELGNVEYKVIRRNARGQFSKRGHYYQAVKRSKQ
jgi:hypothetical protein